MSKTIAVNAGSSTVKFKLFDMPSEEVVAEGQIERIGLEVGHAEIKYGDGQKLKEDKPFADHEAAVQYLLKQLLDLKIVASYDEITAVGHRIVAGGEYFKDSVVIDEDVMNKIDALAEYAPLHDQLNYKVLRLLRKSCRMHLQLPFLTLLFMPICQK